jgi:hypothetical protein
MHDQAGITPVDFDSSRPVDPAQSALRQEKKPSSSPFTPKVGVFWRSAGWMSPRLQPANMHDQAGIIPVDFDSSRPVDPAQSALRREKKPSSSPFTPKVGVFWRSAGGRSPRLQPAIAGSSRHHHREYDPSRQADPVQSALRREKKPSFSPFTPIAGNTTDFLVAHTTVAGTIIYHK